MRRTLALPAAAVVIASTLTGCGAIERGLDCAATAATIAGEVQDVQNAGEDPRAVVRELRDVEQALSDLTAQSEDGSVRQAVADLQNAVEAARQRAESGRVPSLRPILDASNDLTSVCVGG